MDDHPVLWDAIWRPVMSLAFLFHRPPEDVVPLVLVVRRLSRAHLRLERALWAEIESPFLAQVPFAHALRALWCELLQRRFLRDVESLVRDVTRRRMCVAGGFAAWRLDRRLDTLRGGDGYPRAVRDGFVSDGYVRRELWVPADVNIFVESDADDDLVLEAIGTRYVLLCAQLFCDPRVVTTSAVASSESSDPATALDLAQALDECEFGEDVRRMCRDQTFLDGLLEGTPPPRAWRSHTLHATRHEPLVPTRVTVTFVERDAGAVERVVESFDLAHCAILCRVDDATGAYTFRGTEVAVDALARRRVQLADGVLTRSRAAMRATLERLRRYVDRGFSVRGVAAPPPQKKVSCSESLLTYVTW